MKKSKKIDLGKDKIGVLMFKLALPAIAAQLINALYNIVDRMYIGHIPGAGALALTGLGVCFPIIMLISAFSALVGMGGAPLASIQMGAKKNEKAENIMANCFVMLICVAVLLTIGFQIFKAPLLQMFGASADTLPYATEYLGIYLSGTIFVQLALGMNLFINTQGFAKTGMMTVLIGAIINIVLDPILIFGFNMGVRGAALATVISQAVSAIWVVLFLFGKKTTLKFKKPNFKLKKEFVLPVLALGISPFAMQATESLVSIVLNSSLQQYGGDVAVGAMTIITSVMQFITMPLMGLGQGAQPIMSYNYGAQQFDRVRKAFKVFLASCLTFTTLCWLAIMIFPQVFVMMFNSQDAQLMDTTVWAIRIFLSMIFVFGAQTACQQTFLAMGQAKISLFLALLRKVILLIPLALILPRTGLGLVGVFYAEPIADLLATTTTVTIFIISFKKLLHLTDQK